MKLHGFFIVYWILFSGHPGISVNKLYPLSLRRWNIRHFTFDFHRLKMADSWFLEEVTSPRKRELLHIRRFMLSTVEKHTKSTSSLVYHFIGIYNIVSVIHHNTQQSVMDRVKIIIQWHKNNYFKNWSKQELTFPQYLLQYLLQYYTQVNNFFF
jgi:hypothetical protein